MKPKTLTSVNNCSVCGEALVYGTEPVTENCVICGREERALIHCPAGHYVCDSCHSKAALEALRQVLSATRDTNPAAILEEVMAQPIVPMHGPEHHSMVPGSIVTAVKNAGYSVPDRALEKVLERASKVPGGWCGFYGDCGAAVGAGIAVSVITRATPLTGKPRSLALAATSYALSQMLDDQPRCCKRASRTTVRSALNFLRDHLDIKLPQPEKVICTYSLRNKECAHEQCPYYDSHA